MVARSVHVDAIAAGRAPEMTLARAMADHRRMEHIYAGTAQNAP